jgi:hypothetical protein
MKIRIEDLELALSHIKKRSNAHDVTVTIERHSLDTLVIKTYDRAENGMEIMLYDTGSATLPQLKQTVWLTKEA